MTPEQLLSALGECIAEITHDGSGKKWTASQWREFSRATNQLISEQWSQAPCTHSGLRYSTPTGERCNLCLRSVEAVCEQ